MVQEENSHHQVVGALGGGSLFEARIGDSQAAGIGARLPHGGGREVGAHHLGHARGEQQLRVADSASQAEHAGARTRPGHSQNALHHVPAQRAHGRACEVRLGETRVELFVILQLSLKSVFHAAFRRSRKPVQVKNR